MSEQPASRNWTDAQAEQAGIPPRLRHCSKESWRGEWPDTDLEDMIFIHGPVGSGKSHLAVAILRRSWELGAVERLGRVQGTAGNAQYGFRSHTYYGARFADIQESCERMKPNRDEHLADELGEAELLVFDDLGAERLTDWTMDRVSLILRHRYNHMLPTIVTSNLKPSEIHATDPRLASRLLSGTIIKREGEDQRLA